MRWRESPDFVYGVDLFNQGFYWEAHEVWEGLWKAAGKAGTTAEFLKGLIKLAAAAIKRREGRAAGADHLAEGAIAHLSGVAASIGGQTFAGLNLATAIGMAGSIRASIREGAPPSTPPFPGFLVLRNE
jgi:uncharacterized protein